MYDISNDDCSEIVYIIKKTVASQKIYKSYVSNDYYTLELRF